MCKYRCMGGCLYKTARNANDQNNFKSTDTDKYLNTINNRVVKYHWSGGS